MSDPLVDLQTFSDFRGVSLDSSDTAALAIDAASEVFRGLTGRTFDLVTDDEILMDGPGADALVLPNAIVPVIEVTEVGVTPLDEDEVVLDAADYILGPSSILYRKAFTTSEIGSRGKGWPKGTLNVRLVLTHGYEEIPADVQGAVCELASGVLLTGSTGGQILESETLGAYSVTYATTTASTEVQVPGSVQSVIERYRLPSLRPPVGISIVQAS